jgi:hypothetical protein
MKMNKSSENLHPAGENPAGFAVARGFFLWYADLDVIGRRTLSGVYT